VTDERKSVTIRISGEFDARLTDIERYWSRRACPENFRRLIASIREQVMPLLKRFPAIGRRFFNTRPDTVDALLALEDLSDASHRERGELHEYLFDDYVLLYSLSNDCMVFLSIRYTKEVSCEFHDLWGGEP
jgi:hypothetical protein